ncbi:MAG: YggU family protein [Desulfatitalea sp.]|nr:YggU family protein [Desulfatitalea sp.]NNK00403.1 YggU family protein [Desulfatitalea sp.]
MIEIRAADDGITFHVYVQPRASTNTIVGSHEKALKIRLTAPPMGGAANKQCIEVLAKTLAVPKSRIKILSGHTRRRKQICLQPKHDAFTAAECTDLIKRVKKLAQPVAGSRPSS